jgi:hypothetical protein
VTFLLSRCGERDLALSLELACDLPAECRLVGLDGQGDVGPLLEAPAKKACVVCRATPSEKASPTAWINLPSRFIVLSSSYCFEEAQG